MVREDDRSNFVRLAEARVRKAIKSIQLIGNLSNRSNYDFTDEDVAKIFKALNDEISACRRRFEFARKKPGDSNFTLD
jgi:hypothetical protein